MSVSGPFATAIAGPVAGTITDPGIGGGGGGGYWNPATQGALIVLSNGDRDSTNASGTVDWNSGRGLTGHSTGKWYAEEEMTINTASSGMFGVGTIAGLLNTYLGTDSASFGIQNDTSSTVYGNGGYAASSITPPAFGERAMVAYDAATGGIWLGALGTWAGGGDPAAGTSPTFTISPGTQLYLMHAKARSSQAGMLANMPGENTHSIPSGFSMWG